MISRAEQNWPEEIKQIDNDPLFIDKESHETLQEYIERLMKSESRFDRETR